MLERSAMRVRLRIWDIGIPPARHARTACPSFSVYRFVMGGDFIAAVGVRLDGEFTRFWAGCTPVALGPLIRGLALGVCDSRAVKIGYDSGTCCRTAERTWCRHPWASSGLL